MINELGTIQLMTLDKHIGKKNARDLEILLALNCLNDVTYLLIFR